jgi:hypothetical protein
MQLREIAHVDDPKADPGVAAILPRSIRATRSIAPE